MRTTLATQLAVVASFRLFGLRVQLDITSAEALALTDAQADDLRAFGATEGVLAKLRQMAAARPGDTFVIDFERGIVFRRQHPKQVRPKRPKREPARDARGRGRVNSSGG